MDPADFKRVEAQARELCAEARIRCDVGRLETGGVVVFLTIPDWCHEKYNKFVAELESVGVERVLLDVSKK